MLNKLFVSLQSLLPQHALSRLAGCLANTRTPWIKNKLITFFMRHYAVDMNLALETDPYQYNSFNDFFTRRLNPLKRPIAADTHTVVSPVDGTLAAIGRIQQNQLLQAKGAYFDLDTLCGDQTLGRTFYDGHFATLYLAPHNYHRVHMPLAGKLRSTLYIPGRLFSVNPITTQLVPQLYSRNERLICVFETAAGLMAIILVGAMIVGSMQTAWMQTPIQRRTTLLQQTFTDEAPTIAKGGEMGMFKLGSTVILLFEANKIHWGPDLVPGLTTVYGEAIGKF